MSRLTYKIIIVALITVICFNYYMINKYDAQINDLLKINKEMMIYS